MEDTLHKILKESGNQDKWAALHAKALQASDYLDQTQVGSSAEQCRLLVTDVVRSCLETGHSRLVTLGICCLHKMVRDDRFHSRTQPDEDAMEDRWLSVQVLAAIHCINTLNNEQQQDLLKILLTMSCCKDWLLNGRIVVQIVSLCLDMYVKGCTPVRAAAMAIVEHTLGQYGKWLGQPKPKELQVDQHHDAITVWQFLCARMEEGIREMKRGHVLETGLVLQALLTSVNSLPDSLTKNPFFVKFLWQRFNPTFLVYLGLHEPGSARNWLPKKPKAKLEPKNMKLLYVIGVELIRILGSELSLRPVLESIFHRMLICQGKQFNLEALMVINEHFLAREDSVLQVALAPFRSDLPPSSGHIQADSMAIFKLVSDSLEACGHEEVGSKEAQVLALLSFHSLFTSIEKILRNKEDPDAATAQKILTAFPDMLSCDYHGPKRYNYKDRLPAQFVDVIDQVLSCHHEPIKEADQVPETGMEQSEPEESGTSEEHRPEVDQTAELEQPEEENPVTEEEPQTNSDQGEDLRQGTCANEPEADIIPASGVEAACHVDDIKAMKDASSESEDTEGPEEGFDHDDATAVLQRQTSVETSASICERQNLLPRKLMSESELSREVEADEELVERENAHIFLSSLKEELRNILAARGSIEVDQKLQEFASKYCHDYSALSSFNPSKRKLILNADGVYITSYMTLHLNMTLASLKAYSRSQIRDARGLVPSRDQFVDRVLGCGLLIFLSPIWLDEIYSTVRELDVLGFALDSGCKASGLRNVLSDLDGFGNVGRGARLLSDYRRLGPGILGPQDGDDAGEKARVRICRQLLTTCWSSFVSCFNHVLPLDIADSKVTDSKRNVSTLSHQHLLQPGIQCLITAAQLCSRLQLHERVGEVLAPLVQLLCASGKSSFSLIAMESVLSQALEYGSQAEDCWKHIMKLATFVMSSCSANSQASGKAALAASQAGKKRPAKGTEDNDDLHLDQLGLHLSPDPILPFMMAAGSRGLDNSKTIMEILNTSIDSKSGALNSDQMSQCYSVLQSLIETLFDEAAGKLDMDALLGFLRELCFCSHRELLAINSMIKSGKKRGQLSWSRTGHGSASLDLDEMLLPRIVEVMLRSIKTGRPLIHLIKAWAIVGPHLIEASCHTTFSIAKRAVDNIHSLVTAFMQNTSELIYFHFNEALFKPFEHLVRLEMCDQAIQDQIVACICEFVESHAADIKSGWRPLFGALKHITFSDSVLDDLIPLTTDMSQSEVAPETGNPDYKETRAVLDVFDAFLAVESPHVFANAALDCVVCLIRHIRGSEERRQLEEIVDIENNVLNHQGAIHLGRACLTYLLQSHEILMRMSRMTQKPVFAGTHRIHTSNEEKPAVIDATIPYLKVVSFDAATDTMPEFRFSFQALQTTTAAGELNDVLAKDNSHGLFRLWFILADGLCSSIANCPKSYQPLAIDTFFLIVTSFQHLDSHMTDPMDQKVNSFGYFAVNHVLLPMLQNWLRKCGHSPHDWAVSGQSFKQCIGKATELVMSWFRQKLADPEQHPAVHQLLMLKQLLLLLVECTVVPVESIARLGCSCLRHIIVSGSDHFRSQHWDLVCLSVCRAIQVTLYPLHQLMAPFERGSTNFYGDVADVKVAARRDSSRKENHRVQQLAQQVLLLDQQRGELPKMPMNPDAEEKSFLFLLHPPNLSDSNRGVGPLRISLRSLITGLISNQLLLQMIGKVLLQGSPFSIPSLTNFLSQGPGQDNAAATSASSLPGLMAKLNPQQINILLESLWSTYAVAMEFDSRPGLKFLLQKVALLDHAANLYKTAGAAWSLRYLALFHLSLNGLHSDPDQRLQDLKSWLERRSKKRNTCSSGAPDDNAEPAEPDEELEFMQKLYDESVDIVETYADVIVDKDGQKARLDEMVKQQLFFLSVDPPLSESIFSPEEPPSTRPFQFSDFARQQRQLDDSDYADECGSSKGMRQVGSVDADEEVFSMTTQTDKDSLVSEFRHHKSKRVITSSDHKARTNPFATSSSMARLAKLSSGSGGCDADIVVQQKKSLMVDSEAQVKVWTDLVCTPLLICLQLDPEHLRTLLPLIFPAVKLLLVHAEGHHLKQHLAELWHRSAAICNLTQLDAQSMHN